MTTETDRRSWTRFAPGAFSAVASFLILVYLWQPLDDGLLRRPTWHAGVVALAMLALFGTFLTVGVVDLTSTRSKIVAACVLPLVCLAGWAVYQRPAHAIQQEALTVWDRYTHRFPAGHLGEPGIVERWDHDQLIVCASERPDDFCLQMALDDPAGKEVAGGFRTRYIEEYEGVVSYDAYDCFGATIACPEE
jgi:hypothetical protein